MYVITLSFLTAFILTYFAIPSIIQIAKDKHLYDEPVARSSHKERTPSLGGVGIFAGAIFSIVLWTPFEKFGNLQYILCALLILFLIGAKDDISPVSPGKKMIGQIMAASILVFKSDIVLHSMYGLMGLTFVLPSAAAFLLTVFTFLVLINAFNLIDGINGLAGSIGALVAGTLGCWFYLTGFIEYATVAFAMVGATLAFLKYNFSPAQLFMGDTGSLILGLVSAILVIQFIDLNSQLPPDHAYYFEGGLAIAVSIIIIPLFDTMRVFMTRILRGKSPFEADRRHIHHLLIDYGCSHMQATGVLVMANVVIICTALSLHAYLEMHLLLLLLIIMASASTYWLHTQVMNAATKPKVL